MAEFIIYTTKCLFCFVFFYLFNKILLDRETFHRLNRWAWIGVIAISLTLPLGNVEWMNSYDETVTQTLTELSSEPISTPISTVAQTVDNHNILIILLSIYAAGVVFFSLRMGYTYYRLIRDIIKSKREKRFNFNGNARHYPTMFIQLVEQKEAIGVERPVHIILQDDCTIPFSWMNYIFISKDDFDINSGEILRHELAHIKQCHTLDILLIDLVLIFQWMNPAVWLLKHSIQQVHEYQADEAVIHSGVEVKSYQMLLIRKSVGIKLFSMVNGFNYNKLKNRITMMSKKKSSRWAYAKYAYVLPLAFAVATVFATPAISSKLAIIDEVVKQSTEPIYLLNGKIISEDILHKINIKQVSSLDIIKDIKEIEKLKVQLGTHFEQAKKNGVVLVVLMDKKDSLKVSDTVVIALPRNDDNLVINAVHNVKKDVSVSENKKSIHKAINELNKHDKNNSKFKPMYILDGFEVSTIDNIDMNTIKSITILKNESAQAIYGKKGKNGVVVIDTKTK